LLHLVGFFYESHYDARIHEHQIYETDLSLYVLILVRLYCGQLWLKNEMGEECGMHGGGTGVYRVLVGKPEGKRPRGRPRRRWKDNIEMDLQEVGCRGINWIDMAQDRDRWRAFVNAVMNLRVP